MYWSWYWLFCRVVLCSFFHLTIWSITRFRWEFSRVSHCSGDSSNCSSPAAVNTVRKQIAKYIDLWLSQCQKPSASGYGSHSLLVPGNFWILIPFGSFSTDAGSGNHELLTRLERVNGGFADPGVIWCVSDDMCNQFFLDKGNIFGLCSRTQPTCATSSAAELHIGEVMDSPFRDWKSGRKLSQTNRRDQRIHHITTTTRVSSDCIACQGFTFWP